MTHVGHKAFSSIRACHTLMIYQVWTFLFVGLLGRLSFCLAGVRSGPRAQNLTN